MKKIFILSFLILICTASFGQGNKNNYGIKIGITGNKERCPVCMNSILFPTFGFYGNWEINSNISILSMFQYQRIGAQSRNSSPSYMKDISRSMKYIYFNKITNPILLKMNVLTIKNFQVSSLIGMTPNFLVNGRDLAKSYQDLGNGRGYSKTNDINPLNGSYSITNTRVIRRPKLTNIQAEAGIMMSNQTHYTLCLTYQIGEPIDYQIVNGGRLYDLQTHSIRNDQFVLSIMYQLRRNKE